MTTLYTVWLATDDAGQPTTRRVFFQATTDLQRAVDAATTVRGTITSTTEYTPDELRNSGPIGP